MKINIHYQAVFHYVESASFSPHVVRLFPRRDMGVQVNRLKFSTHASADIQHRQDIFDNLVANCFFPERLSELAFDLTLDLDIVPRNPFHFLLDARAMELPLQYTEHEKEVLAPCLRPRFENVALPPAIGRASSGRSTVETLVEINQWLHGNIAYERREEGDPLPPDVTLAERKGSCRDFAVVLAEVLRRHGVAARLVSGFLWEGSVAQESRRADNALHAWVESYLPGAGWIGMDPTNGVFCDHHFLPTAIGLTPADIAPINGHYYGNKTIASTLETKLTIDEEKP